jgi:hypothetical protein
MCTPSCLVRYRIRPRVRNGALPPLPITCSSSIPNLEETYCPGAALDLYAWPHPAPPTSIEPKYTNGRPKRTKLIERYNKSVAQRVTLPSTPPAVSITLEKRLASSMSPCPPRLDCPCPGWRLVCSNDRGRDDDRRHVPAAAGGEDIRPCIL